MQLINKKQPPGNAWLCQISLELGSPPPRLGAKTLRIGPQKPFSTNSQERS